jgi:hypothetical protein
VGLLGPSKIWKDETRSSSFKRYVDFGGQEILQPEAAEIHEFICIVLISLFWKGTVQRDLRGVKSSINR